MLPPWIIEELERARREREVRRAPGLRVELPEERPPEWPEPEERRPGGTVIVIEL